MGDFWRALGTGLAFGAGAGAGFAVTNHVLNNVFDYPSYHTYGGYRAHQFQRMNDFMAGRQYQAAIDRHMLGVMWGRGCFFV